MDLPSISRLRMNGRSVITKRHSAPLIFVAIVGFSLSLMVHLLTYVNIAVQEQCPLVWGLHVGIFVVFVPFIRAPKQQSWLKIRTPFPGLPPWARIVLVTCFLYGGVSFVWATLHLADMLPVGLTIQPVSYPHTHQYNIYQMRLFSGLWLTFYLMPALFFLEGQKVL